MKKKYRMNKDLKKSSEFSVRFSNISEPLFADLVNSFLPQKKTIPEESAKSSDRKTPLFPLRSFLPESQIDLHGLTADEAEKKTHSYLLTQKQRGRKSLRIITGKGLHSLGPGVLRDVVEIVLKEAVSTGMVAGYCWEQKQKEKSGAVLVFLS